MDTKLPYYGSVIFGAIALVLVVVNISLANANHAMQMDVQQRQATIGGAQTFVQLDQFLIQALAESANKNNNTAARDLLAAQGLRLKPQAAAEKTTVKTTEKK